jgi:phosphomevalonate kinase
MFPPALTPCAISSTAMPQCTASAPGKVLVAGGYLVLLRPNVGIVVGMSARFTATVQGALRF